MRRKDFLIEDKDTLYNLLDKSEYGTMGIKDSLNVYLIPLNFCRKHNSIYFHGAKDGRKASLIENKTNVSFSVSKPYAYIPSYFGNINIPTQFFASIYIEGIINIIENMDTKKEAIITLMDKYEKESDNVFITDNVYEKTIKNTMICEIKINSITGKYKFGQNMSVEKRRLIINDLEKRGNNIDIETIDMMKTLMEDL